MKVIVVTGTPGAGKTTVAKKLARLLRWKYVDIHSLIKKHKLHTGYDRSLQCYVVPIKRLVTFLLRYIKESKKHLVIDSHLSHHISKNHVTLCIITTCDIKMLKKRLEKRKYSAKKIRNNLDTEIIQTCLQEASEQGYPFEVIDTTKNITEKKLQSIIKKYKKSFFP